MKKNLNLLIVACSDESLLLQLYRCLQNKVALYLDPVRNHDGYVAINTLAKNSSLGQNNTIPAWKEVFMEIEFDYAASLETWIGKPSSEGFKHRATKKEELTRGVFFLRVVKESDSDVDFLFDEKSKLDELMSVIQISVATEKERQKAENLILLSKKKARSINLLWLYNFLWPTKRLTQENY